MVALVVVVWAACGAPAQNTVTLHAGVRVAPSGGLSLGDVATVEGPDAQSLAMVEIVGDVATELGASAGGTVRVEVARVRSAIARDGSVPLGRVLIRGLACVIGSAARAKDMTQEASDRESSESVPASGPTVRAEVERLVSKLTGASGADLRLEWDSRDRELLTMSTVGRAVHVRRLGSSAHVPVAVRVYEGERLIAQGTVRVGVRVRRDVLIARGMVRRGEVIGADRVARGEQWVGPGVRPAGHERVIGRVATRTIEAGEVVELGAVERPIAIERGAIVDVHCLSGSILIMDRARALDDGREGDSIRFESVDGKRRRFVARVDSPGRAVVLVGGSGHGVEREARR